MKVLCVFSFIVLSTLSVAAVPVTNTFNCTIENFTGMPLTNGSGSLIIPNMTIFSVPLNSDMLTFLNGTSSWPLKPGSHTYTSMGIDGVSSWSVEATYSTGSGQYTYAAHRVYDDAYYRSQDGADFFAGVTFAGVLLLGWWGFSLLRNIAGGHEDV